MITKVFNSFFLGLILYLILDFLVFIGIKTNYLDYYHIKEYYNVLFVDHQNYIILVIISFVFGYLMMQKKSAKAFAFFYIFLIVLSFSTFLTPIGRSIGEYLFRKNDLVFRLGKVKFSGDLLYKGRVYTYIYRKDINKVIKLKNSELTILK